MNYQLTADDMRAVAKRENAAARAAGAFETTWNTIKSPDVSTVKAMADERARRAQILYLTALLDSPKTTRQVAVAVDRQANTTARALRTYEAAGLVSVDMRTSGSICAITDAGREWLEANK